MMKVHCLLPPVLAGDCSVPEDALNVSSHTGVFKTPCKCNSNNGNNNHHHNEISIKCEPLPQRSVCCRLQNSNKNVNWKTKTTTKARQTALLQHLNSVPNGARHSLQQVYSSFSRNISCFSRTFKYSQFYSSFSQNSHVYEMLL